MKQILNKHFYIVIVIVITIISRLVYHINMPFFEDEGLFLLDSGKNLSKIYVNTLYMKPFLGALYFYLIYNIFDSQSFLALHITTTIFIVISNILLYKIVKAETKKEILAVFGPIIFIYFTNLSIRGFAHSSLEHLQLPLLLAIYYFTFINKTDAWAIICLSFAVLIKQNVILTAVALIKQIISKWKITLIITLLILIIIIIFFKRFYYNNFYFPSKYYSVTSIELKIYGFKNYFLNMGKGFVKILLACTLLSSIVFARKYLLRFIFILLLAISIIPTPLYPQHFVVIVPFLIIISLFGINYILIKTENSIIVLTITIISIVYVINLNRIQLYKNHKKMKNINMLTDSQTVEARLNGDSTGLHKLLNFFPTIRGEKVYIYPILFPHPYITFSLKPIEKLYSNDHINTILFKKIFMDTLFNSVNRSNPKYLIRMKESPLDSILKSIVDNKYRKIEEDGKIQIFKIKN